MKNQSYKLLFLVRGIVLILSIIMFGCNSPAPSQDATTEPSPVSQAQDVTADTPTPTPTIKPTSTINSMAISTTEVVPPETPPTVSPVPTDLPAPIAPPATITPVPPSSTNAELAIVSFVVDEIEDVAGGGKRVKCTWETTGAVSARITAGTLMRFPPSWEVEPNGSSTFELADTIYRYPPLTLMAYDGMGYEVLQTITLDWPCDIEYFFAPEPNSCPLYEAEYMAGAYQPFEGGSMVWLEDLHDGERVYGDTIIVLYNNGNWEYFEDTWQSGMPESDPSFEPPPGYYQPIRGFGKLWRENSTLREVLGWALEKESGYDAAFQRQHTETISGIAFIRSVKSSVITLYSWGWTSGQWGHY